MGYSGMFEGEGPGYPPRSEEMGSMERPPLAPEEVRRLGDARRLEREMIFDKKKLRDVGGGKPFNEIRAVAPELADFFEGTESHEVYNQYLAGFVSFLGKEYPLKKGALEFSRKEVGAAWEKYENAGEVKRYGDEAAAFYKKSVSGGTGWSGEKVKVHDPIMLSHDLAYRKEIFSDEGDGSTELNRLDRRYLKNIPEIESRGNRAEYQFILMFRRLVRERSLDHIIQIAHTLPTEDQKGGVDVVVSVGTRMFNLDLKVYDTQDSYAAGHRQSVLDKRAESLEANQGLAVLSVDLFTKAFHVWKERVVGAGEDKLGVVDSATRKILKEFQRAFPDDPDIKSVFTTLRGRAERKKISSEVSDEMYQQYVDGRMFKLFEKELLETYGVGSLNADTDSFGIAKETLVEAVKSAVAQGLLQIGRREKSLAEKINTNPEALAFMQEYIREF